MRSIQWLAAILVFCIGIPSSTLLWTASAASNVPRIVERSEWGADESLLFRRNSENASVPNGEPVAVSAVAAERQKACEELQRKYPDEFRVAQTVTNDGADREYRWPLQYSSSVSVIIVHHTALPVASEKRSGTERMRALYQYHASTLGWGDIGYHYVIDESGVIYEGKAGGMRVVGGHTFCNNVGSIGIALMGNFENEQPSQKQIASFQWLAAHLASEYRIDLHRSVTFHGKAFSAPIIRHRDVLSTACPGYYLATAFPTIVKNIIAGDVNATVSFQELPPEVTAPSLPVTEAMSVSAGTVTAPVSGLQAIGGRSIRINPGGTYRFDMQYTAPQKGARSGSRIAQVALSSQALRLTALSEDGQKDVRGALVLPQSLASGELYTFSLLLSAPVNEGSYWFEIGGTTYTVETVGRRSRLMKIPTSLNVAASSLYSVPLSVRAVPENRPYPVVSRRSATRAVATNGTVSSASSTQSSQLAGKQMMRVRLSAGADSILGFTAGASVNGMKIASSEALRLERSGTSCRDARGTIVAPIIRFEPLSSAGLTQVTDSKGNVRLYRGIIECRVIDGIVALINELPLEEYIRGLAEEPDSEPYEKQRAFAIAARSYAASYLGSVRKFPGKPYDASDSPALFQAYAGVTFERANPSWVKAAASTASLVLWANGSVVRAPYFSSDDGRTRSPAEAGWSNFPNASLFASKDDPWCRGQPLRGHGVGMSGCGAEGQALQGTSAEAILQYYYPGAQLKPL